MTTAKRPHFDIDALRELAGQKVFERGKAYHAKDHVLLLSVKPGRVLARVIGTEDYRTELTGHGSKIGGSCSCEAFAGWGFCKHMVAAALAANTTDGEGAFPRIRDYLKTRPADALIDIILELAGRDAALFHKLELAAAAVHEDEKSLEARLTKAIDGAMRSGRDLDYTDASVWAANAAGMIEPLSDLVASGHAALVLRLVDRALDRISRAAQDIDDYNGDIAALLGRAGEIRLAAAEQARPEPVLFARDLFAREMADEYDTFYRASEIYADVLGETGLAEYRRLASKAWEKLRKGAKREWSDEERRLTGILNSFAERDGDIEARIALRAGNLHSQLSYLQLAEFCFSQGRTEEALQRAEEGLWMFEDQRPDEGLVLFLASRLAQAGRGAEADALLWRTFEKTPGFRLYERLRELAGEAACARAAGFLETRLAREKPARPEDTADLLVSILRHERLFDAAWAAVRKHGASAGLREDLARESVATHPSEAIETFTAQVERLVSVGNNLAYVRAAELVGQMACLQSAADQQVYVVAIRERFARKRNFMKLLG